MKFNEPSKITRIEITKDYLYNIFDLVKNTKKPIVKLYPDGRVIGTDIAFATLNILIHNNKPYDMSYPFIFISTELNTFMKYVQNSNGRIIIDNYGLYCDDLTLDNHLEMSFEIDDLFYRVNQNLSNDVIYRHDNFQQVCEDMLSLKASDGAKRYTIGDDNQQFLMTSFNSIHPANKTDRVDLIIRSLDFYSYMAEFIIYKKKDNYQLHEFMRFRKL